MGPELRPREYCLLQINTADNPRRSLPGVRHFDERFENAFATNPVHRRLGYMPESGREPEIPNDPARWGRTGQHPEPDQIGRMKKAGIDVQEQVHMPHHRECRFEMRVDRNDASAVGAEMEGGRGSIQELCTRAVLPENARSPMRTAGAPTFSRAASPGEGTGVAHPHSGSR